MTLLTLGGFGFLISGAIKLGEVFHAPDPIMAVIVLGIFTIVFCDAMLIRLLGKIVNASLASQKHQPPARGSIAGRDTARQLNSPSFEPVPSVTEHTTRTFSPVYREPSDRGNR